MSCRKSRWVKLLNGVLNAKRLEVLDNGEVMRFSGGVVDDAAPAAIHAKADQR